MAFKKLFKKKQRLKESKKLLLAVDEEQSDSRAEQEEVTNIISPRVLLSDGNNLEVQLGTSHCLADDLESSVGSLMKGESFSCLPADDENSEGSSFIIDLDTVVEEPYEDTGSVNDAASLARKVATAAPCGKKKSEGLPDNVEATVATIENEAQEKSAPPASSEFDPAFALGPIFFDASKIDSDKKPKSILKAKPRLCPMGIPIDQADKKREVRDAGRPKVIKLNQPEKEQEARDAGISTVLKIDQAGKQQESRDAGIPTAHKIDQADKQQESRDVGIPTARKIDQTDKQRESRDAGIPRVIKIDQPDKQQESRDAGIPTVIKIDHPDKQQESRDNGIPKVVQIDQPDKQQGKKDSGTPKTVRTDNAGKKQKKRDPGIPKLIHMTEHVDPSKSHLMLERRSVDKSQLHDEIQELDKTMAKLNAANCVPTVIHISAGEKKDLENENPEESKQENSITDIPTLMAAPSIDIDLIADDLREIDEVMKICLEKEMEGSPDQREESPKERDELLAIVEGVKVRHRKAKEAEEQKTNVSDVINEESEGVADPPFFIVIDDEDSDDEADPCVDIKSTNNPDTRGVGRNSNALDVVVEGDAESSSLTESVSKESTEKNMVETHCDVGSLEAPSSTVDFSAKNKRHKGSNVDPSMQSFQALIARYNDKPRKAEASRNMKDGDIQSVGYTESADDDEDSEVETKVPSDLPVDFTEPTEDRQEKSNVETNASIDLPVDFTEPTEDRQEKSNVETNASIDLSVDFTEPTEDRQEKNNVETNASIDLSVRQEDTSYASTDLSVRQEDTSCHDSAEDDVQSIGFADDFSDNDSEAPSDEFSNERQTNLSNSVLTNESFEEMSTSHMKSRNRTAYPSEQITEENPLEERHDGRDGRVVDCHREISMDLREDRAEAISPMARYRRTEW